jgi:hypothetical protein
VSASFCEQKAAKNFDFFWNGACAPQVNAGVLKLFGLAAGDACLCRNVPV